MNRVVIVGASSGIGLATADLLLAKGASVTCVARRPCPREGVRSLVADMADYHDRVRVAKEVLDGQDAPDALVYCAGTSLCAPAETTPNDDYRYLWEVNYFGMVHLVQLLLPALRLRGGRIVAVSSLAAVAPIPFDAHYGASKSAMVAFLAALQTETAPYGVRITSVLPGGVRTGFTFARKTYDPSDFAQYERAAVNAYATLETIEQRGMRPERVAAYITAILQSPAPPAIFPVGAGNAALYALCRRLPQSAQNQLLAKIYAVGRA